MTSLIGVDYVSKILHRKQTKPPITPDAAAIRADMAFCRANRWNVIRLPYYWEAMFDNEENFFEEYELILQACKDNGIMCVPEFHHFYATSAWGPKGGGFPKEIVDQYHPATPLNYGADPEVKWFWNDLYLNDIRGVPNIWMQVSDVIEQVIHASRSFRSVIYAFEIFNEPHLWKDEQYELLGLMQTAIAKELRKITWKPIMFARETTHGGYQRRPGLEYQILPRVCRTIYDPHLYHAERIDEQVNRWKAVLAQWRVTNRKVGIFVGEFADQETPGHPTKANTELFVKRWHDEAWDAAYWAYNLVSPDPEQVLATPDNVLTVVGKWYVDAIKKYYV